MKFAGAYIAEFTSYISFRSRAKSFRNSGRIKASEREMRRELPRFTRNPQLFEPRIEPGGERRQIWRPRDARPQHTRAFFAREKSKSAKAQLNLAGRANLAQRGMNRVQLSSIHVADELE